MKYLYTFLFTGVPFLFFAQTEEDTIAVVGSYVEGFQIHEVSAEVTVSEEIRDETLKENEVAYRFVFEGLEERDIDGELMLIMDDGERIIDSLENDSYTYIATAGEHRFWLFISSNSHQDFYTDLLPSKSGYQTTYVIPLQDHQFVLPDEYNKAPVFIEIEDE